MNKEEWVNSCLVAGGKKSRVEVDRQAASAARFTSVSSAPAPRRPASAINYFLCPKCEVFTAVKYNTAGSGATLWENKVCIRGAVITLFLWYVVSNLNLSYPFGRRIPATNSCHHTSLVLPDQHLKVLTFASNSLCNSQSFTFIL